jgi:hypothetical protein
VQSVPARRCDRLRASLAQDSFGRHSWRTSECQSGYRAHDPAGKVAITIEGKTDEAFDQPVHVDLTITSGSGKYEGATGTMTFDGFSHAGGPGVGTAELAYRGSVCAPNLKGAA